MTISTISSGVGLKNLGGNKSQTVENHIHPRQNSAGAATTQADGSEDRAVLINAPAYSSGQQNPKAPPVPPVINGLGLGLRFSTDKETGTVIITVVDFESGEVVRQIPSEEAVDFMRQIENDKGSLISLML